MFTDRVEIISPGHLPDSQTPEQIRTGVSNRRNAVLAEHAAHILPYRGMGTGVPRALDAWPQIDLVDEPDINQFRAVVWRTKTSTEVTGQVNHAVLCHPLGAQCSAHTEISFLFILRRRLLPMPTGKDGAVLRMTRTEPSAFVSTKWPFTTSMTLPPRVKAFTQHVLAKGQTTKQYEDEMKRRFIEEPANLKLLIVVSKLLTGFDAPSCTYIYLDNELRDHNLFQAICRTNRLDGDDKDYGHIVDYKELFQKVQSAIAVYTSDELDIDDTDGDDGNVIVKDWLKEGKQKLEEAREALHYLCEPVAQPRQLEQYIRYFCGNAAEAGALEATEPLRISFYKGASTFLRAYADLAQNLSEAG